MYNNRHWIGDVIAGAGIGMLSTKMAFFLHPIIDKALFKKDNKTTAIVVPIYNGQNLGLGMNLNF